MKNKLRIIFYSCLALLVFFAFAFKNNAANIYGTLGNYYYLHNNVKNAQKYYEKAFYLGNNDYKLRENYVNSIINSPLTISAQEKLVKIAEDNIEDTASSNADYFLYNLKREIHNKYPLNYIKQAAYNQKIVHWGKLPITYEFRNTSNVPEDLIKAVNDAFDEWERASSCRIKFEKVKINADIMVDFISENTEKLEEGKRYVVAYTTPSIVQDKLKNVVIKFNINNLDGNLYSPNQIYNTALHEIFHALGFMGHSFDKNNVMYMSKENKSIVEDKRIELTEADKTTLELLYKIKPDITNADELSYVYIPYLILGDNEEINISKSREAKNYIKRAPTLPQGYIDLAENYVQKKKYYAATKLLEKALTLSINKDTKYIIYYNLAVTNFYDEIYDSAMKYADLAKEIKNSEEINFIEAEIYTKQNEITKAAEKYKYLTHNYPNNIEYTINLTNLYVKKRDYLSARKVLKTFLKNNPAEKNNPRLKPYGILKL